MIKKRSKQTNCLAARARVIVPSPVRMCRVWLFVVFVSCCVVIPVPVLRAQSGGYVFTAICPNPPGVPGTSCQAHGINNSGQIVGSWNVGGSAPGFLYNAGVFSPLSFSAQGINNAGEIVGGGVLDVDGTLSSIDFPGAVSTVTSSINNAGQIVGYYSLSVGEPSHAYLYVAGTFNSFDFPGAFQTFATGINDAGDIVGYYEDIEGSSANWHGFLDVAGTFTSIDFPGALSTTVTGINNDGQISGFYSPANGETAYSGFVDTSGGFISFDFPGAAFTQVWGINDAGEVVGWAMLNGTKPPFAFLAVPTTVVNISPTTLSFGNQLAGTTSSAQSVALTNTGNAILYVSSESANGDFTAKAGTCNSPVPVGGSCTIPVTFAPTATGMRTGTLTITDNASPQTQTANLTGTGTAPAATLSPLGLTFPSQPVTTTSTPQTVTLTNSGTASLTVNSIAISGDFAQSNTCGASVAPSANCQISVTFTPTGIGTRSGTLTLSDNASNSPQFASLNGTGSGPSLNFSATSLTFGAQLSGTTSTAQTVTLNNTGNASLTISGITASGDFSQTNSCGSSVSAGGNCTISVTFKPTAGGTRTGSISVSDNAPNSPQAIALSGMGQDFTLAASSGSSTSATAAPGQSATYTLSLVGEGGLSGTVSFTCTGAPSEANCTVSPNPATAASAATNVTVTVSTTAASVSPPRSRPLLPGPPLSPGQKGVLMLALALAAMAWANGRRKQAGASPWRRSVAALGPGLLLTLALAGCGGGGSGGGATPNPGTPAGTYTLTVTGTVGSGSSALSHSLTLTLNVS